MVNPIQPQYHLPELRGGLAKDEFLREWMRNNKMDFTLNTYKLLLSASLTSGYSFQTYFEFVQDTKEKAIIMRHDVDRLSANALQMARLEYEMGIGSTYYFRVVSQSWNESIIREIADLGHEIGYHYEDLSMCKGDMERAIML